MFSIHTLIIVIAALNGIQLGANNFRMVANPLYNLFVIINILIEFMFYMLVAYKYPILIVIETIITDLTLIKHILYIVKKLITTLIPSLNWEQ